MTLTTGKPAPRNADAAAFTLVELVLVMTLLTVVMALAAPALAPFFRGRSLDAEARRLLALSRYAQNRAATEGFPMTLWLDAQGRAYGLEAETGTAEADPKAVECELERELGLDAEESALSADVAMAPARAQAQAQARARSQQAQTGLASTISGHSLRGLPALRFLPDGTIDAASPDTVRLYDKRGAALWLRRARNGLTYEIGEPTNGWAAARQ
jgi:type II secretory pathway pseudopilin PulG